MEILARFQESFPLVHAFSENALASRKAEDMANRILGETAELVRDTLGDSAGDLAIERAVFGLFFTGVKITGGYGGLCFTPIKELPEAVCCPSSAKAMPRAGRLAGGAAVECLKDLDHDNVLRKTLAIAVLNALSSACWRKKPPTNYRITHGRDAFDEATIPISGKTVVVGALVPILRKLLAAGAEFTVLEQDPRTLKGRELDHYAPAADAPRHIPEANLLVVTGTTVINDTLPGILELAKPGAEIVVTGPTASMLPDAFFRRGVTILGGIAATDPDSLLDVIAEAGSGYHFFGKSAERMTIGLVP